MIIVKCLGEFAFGGRTEDLYVVEEANSLDDLQEYIKNKMPIKCKEPTSIHKWTIIEEESMVDRIVYLNNYMKIKEVFYYIATSEQIKNMSYDVCKDCRYNTETLTALLSCCYDRKSGSLDCKRYDAHFIRKIRDLFSKTSN